MFDFFQFVKHGKFDSVELGCTKEWLLTNFKTPNSQHEMSEGMFIWLYDRIEFHFYEDTLFQIWCDDLNYLKDLIKKSVDNSKFNGSLLVKNIQPTLMSLMFDLSNQCIDFDTTFDCEFKTARIRISNSQVDLHFEDGRDDAKFVSSYNLVAIGYSHPDYRAR